MVIFDMKLEDDLIAQRPLLGILVFGRVCIISI
jgi:hypothetical protein